MRRFSIVAIVLSIILTACGGAEIDTNMSGEVADFEFTTQDHEPFGLKDLKGGWWVAHFMYTSCTIVCPTTVPNMARVQSELDDSGLEGVAFVSFSVQPETDTPDVLKEYVSNYAVDLSNWHFLTGYAFEEIQKLSNTSFKAALEDGGPEEHELIHSTAFYLVNPEGEVVKKYEGMTTQGIKSITQDLKKVL
ncbi:putative copper-binding protein [Lentibacillus sp. JNUCC-1]|nr:putative copper-binding protein [Lentibacillus sp. JNUCC-1]